MNAVLCQGGLCTTKAGLDQLYKNGKAENLKDQIRYRKLVMRARGLKTDRHCCKSLPDFAWKDMQWTPL